MEFMTKLLKAALHNKVSDIHLRSGDKPYFRVSGELTPVKSGELDVDTIVGIMQWMGAKVDKANLPKELDGGYEVEGVCRIRYNFFQHLNGLGIIIRIIPLEIPTIDELKLPQVLKKIASTHSGLVLVCGATGSGKSSTLAAMINHINKTKHTHILTLEDPIEFVHESQKSRITQREIGHNSESFEEALRASLRQDPDVILVGEMRDAITVSTALKAAETGHRVFGTLHTTNALNTIGRLIAMFSPGEQPAVRTRLSDNLYASIGQRLVKTKDGKGRLAAQEIMLTSPGIKESISDPDKTNEIYTYIRKGKKTNGSQTFDQHLTEFYHADLITQEEAMANASSPEDFLRNLNFSSDH